MLASTMPLSVHMEEVFTVFYPRFVSLYKEAEGDEDLLIRAGRTQSDIDILFSRPNPQVL